MFTYALGIDNRGSVIGRWSSPSQDIFVRSPNGTLSYLALPSGVTVLTEAAISENGRIVVSANDSMYFLDGQTYAAVAVPGAGGAGNAVNVGGINNSGDVVGYYYTNSGTSPSFFRDLKGAFETIDVPGSAYTNVMGLNDLGQAVGFYYDGAQFHGFLWIAGTITPLDYPGAAGTFANGINDAGEIVGYYNDASGNAHGFLASPTSSYGRRGHP